MDRLPLDRAAVIETRETISDIGDMRAANVILALVATLAVAGGARGQEADLASALGGYDASLRPLGDLVVHADFDGDGDRDFAAVVTDGSRSVFLVLQAGEGEWQVRPLYARLPDVPVRLRVIQPGSHRVLDAQRTVELRDPGVELIFPGRSSALYAWRDGRWQVYGTENY
ncbi:MAG: hypothetical protein KY397_01055 [Gemmatimonadetes bacterium]|nr:hypothetical protein [Gemmatimonadota bacterium]